MKSTLSSFKVWSLLILGGLAKGFAYHPLPFSYILAWFCLIPIIYIMFNYKQKRIFFKGYSFGVIFNLSAFYWIGLNSGTNNFIANLSLVLAVLYLSLFWGTLTLFISLFKNWHFKLALLPFCFVLMEWSRSLGPLGFSWSNFALTQINFLQLMQISEYVGSFGISFLVVVINILFFLIVFRKKYGLAFFFLLSLFIIFKWGDQKINHFNNYNEQIDVAIIQPNIDPNLKWLPKNHKNTIRYLDSLYHQVNGIRS